MKFKKNNLIIRQLDEKLQRIQALKDIMPPAGWITLMRKTLNMSLRQLGNRMSITPQSVRDIEKREEAGTLTLRTLKQAAKAFDMVFVYGFIPKDGSLEKMIGHKAREMAEKIVERTSTTMKLEDQENSGKRIKQAIEELTEELKKEMPKSLWD